MKKILAVLMAVLMLCSGLALGVSAFVYQGYEVKPDEMLTILRFNGGTTQIPYTHRNFSTGVDELSDCEGEIGVITNVGFDVSLPMVKAPEGYSFAGWVDANDTTKTYAAGAKYRVSDADAGNYMVLTAQLVPAEVGPSTLDTVKSVLIKVFGVIIGLFYGDIDYGQELVANLFGSILG